MFFNLISGSGTLLQMDAGKVLRIVMIGINGVFGTTYGELQLPFQIRSVSSTVSSRVKNNKMQFLNTILNTILQKLN